MDLPPKQLKFVEEYLLDLNATQAAIRSGYSPKTACEQASRLLANVKVKSAIAQAKEKASERTEISQDWVLSNLKAVAERCMQTAPVYDRKGNPVLVETADGDVVPAYTFNAMGANRSLELLGKHIGLFADTLKVGGDATNPIKTVLEVNFVKS